MSSTTPSSGATAAPSGAYLTLTTCHPRFSAEQRLIIHAALMYDDHLLMASSAPLTAARYRERGYTVTEVDVSEFEKLEGCVTCLSVRLRG